MQAELPPTKYSFSGHETFPCRYAWPTKGVRITAAYPDLFIRDDAIVLLGVGKNMVAAIRHWCDALGLIEKEPNVAMGHMRPTLLGKALYGIEGWDPYLENPGTLWLLHWRLVSRRDRASTWFLAFTKWNTEAFTRDKLTNWVWSVAQDSSKTVATLPSLQRDVEVFIRSYVPTRTRREIPIEDTFDCPLVELGLIEEIEPGLYRFVRGPKPTLPNDIFILALLEYWETVAPAQQTLSFESLLHGPGSPGAAFKLSENALSERLESLPSWSKLQYDDTAGMRVLLRHDSSNLNPLDILSHFYNQADINTTVGNSGE